MAAIKDVSETLPNQLESLGEKSGLYFHLLTAAVNGSMTINKKGFIKMPIELNIAHITGEKQSEQDLRTVFPPNIWNNKLVPLLVYVDPVKFEEFMKKQK